MDKKTHVGLVEKVKVIGERGEVETLAKFDTGASNNSIDYLVAAEAGIGPVVGSAKIKSASAAGGYKRRPIVEVDMEVKGKKFHSKANLGDRQNMNYKVLIGRELIHRKFIVDVSKTQSGVKETHVKDDVLKKTKLNVGETKIDNR